MGKFLAVGKLLAMYDNTSEAMPVRNNYTSLIHTVYRGMRHCSEVLDLKITNSVVKDSYFIRGVGEKNTGEKISETFFGENVIQTALQFNLKNYHTRC